MLNSFFAQPDGGRTINVGVVKGHGGAPIIKQLERAINGEVGTLAGDLNVLWRQCVPVFRPVGQLEKTAALTKIVNGDQRLCQPGWRLASIQGEGQAEGTCKLNKLVRRDGGLVGVMPAFASRLDVLLTRCAGTELDGAPETDLGFDHDQFCGERQGNAQRVKQWEAPLALNQTLGVQRGAQERHLDGERRWREQGLSSGSRRVRWPQGEE